MLPTAQEWLRKLRDGDISATELCTLYLERIAAENPRLNAVVAHDPAEVLASAKKADRDRAVGVSLPLLGLPITVKDNMDVVGLPCRAGSRRRRELPTRDAEIVRRLSAAGAIVLGKTNMPELGLAYETDNRVYGRTNHPLDVARTPGGSSGGEAAILATDASPVGIGTDGGGSIRVPSHYCGLIGLRPTVGRVPTTGSWPGSRTDSMFDLTCVGPIGRSTDDLALLLDVISGPDWVDPFAHPVPLQPWRSVDVAELRVGWYLEDGMARPTDGTADAVKAAAGALRASGASVRQVTPPDVTEATALFFEATAADGGAGVRDTVGDADEDHTNQFLRLVRDPPYPTAGSVENYLRLLRRIFAFRARLRLWIEDFDVILAPTCAGPAPLHGVMPGSGDAADDLRYEALNYTHTYSVAGLPAASVPAGEEAGLPIGVQVVSRAWREDVVLAATAVIECATGGYQIVHSRHTSRTATSG